MVSGVNGMDILITNEKIVKDRRKHFMLVFKHNCLHHINIDLM